MFSPNDTVRCNDDSGFEEQLTKGKVYTVGSSDKGFTNVVNDNGTWGNYATYRFVLVTNVSRTPMSFAHSSGFQHGSAAAEKPKKPEKPESALETQVGGDHYTKLAIQPFEYSMRNKLDPMQHTIVKYVTRFRDKKGRQDLEKAKHCIDLLIEHEYGE